MNEHFVRMIFSEAQADNFIKTFAGAVAHTIDSHLNEDENGIILKVIKQTKVIMCMK